MLTREMMDRLRNSAALIKIEVSDFTTIRTHDFLAVLDTLGKLPVDSKGTVVVPLVSGYEIEVPGYEGTYTSEYIEHATNGWCVSWGGPDHDCIAFSECTVVPASAARQAGGGS